MQATVLALFLAKLFGIKQAALPTPLAASRTLTSADNGLTFTNSTGGNITLTTQTGLPAGFKIHAIQTTSAGTITLAGVTGATVSGAGAIVKTNGQWAKVTLEQATATVFALSGNGAT